VLDFFKTSRAGVQVDLKRPGIERDVAEAVRRHGLEERTFVSSTSPRALRRLAAAAPSLPRSISYPNDRYRVSRFTWPSPVTTATAAAVRAAMPVRIRLLLRASGAGALTIHHALVSAAAVRAVNAPVIAWTVNDPVEIRRLAALGVAGIVTDDPGMAVETLARLDSP
jgi:glycerophosphoryl diester phosphodiesterase